MNVSFQKINILQIKLRFKYQINIHFWSANQQMLFTVFANPWHIASISITRFMEHHEYII